MAEHPPVPRGEGRDPLEAELASFRPTPPTARLAERIGETLASDGVRERVSLPLRRRLFVAAAIAACVVLAVSLWRGGEGPPTIVTTLPTSPDPVVAVPELPPPSRAAYQRALAESPGALDALLDAHAPRLFPAAGGGDRGGDAFHLSRTELLASNGETL